jgi:NitT/TauT family transport system substrate-binding protein
MRKLISTTVLLTALGAVPVMAQTKTSFAPTTLQISVGHAGQSSIPLVMGYWKQEGLDVDVFGVNGSTAGIQQIAAGNLDFATVGGDALLTARAKGVKVKAVYMYARRSIYKTVVLASSKYKSINDLKGGTIGRSSTAEANVIYFKTSAHLAGLDPEKDFKWLTVPVGALALALEKGEIAALSTWDTMVASLENRGMQLRELVPPHHDELFGNVVVTRDELIEKRPELVAKVLRGIAKASQFGLANPEAAIRIHWRQYPQTKPQHGSDPAAIMRQSMKVFLIRFKGLELFGTDKYGESLPAQWARAAAMAKEQGIVPADFDPREAWTNQLIDEANKFDRAAIIAQAKAWKE